MSIEMEIDRFGMYHGTIDRPDGLALVTALWSDNSWWVYVDGHRVPGTFATLELACAAAELRAARAGGGGTRPANDAAAADLPRDDTLAVDDHRVDVIPSNPSDTAPPLFGTGEQPDMPAQEECSQPAPVAVPTHQSSRPAWMNKAASDDWSGTHADFSSPTTHTMPSAAERTAHDAATTRPYTGTVLAAPKFSRRSRASTGRAPNIISSRRTGSRTGQRMAFGAIALAAAAFIGLSLDHASESELASTPGYLQQTSEQTGVYFRQVTDAFGRVVNRPLAVRDLFADEQTGTGTSASAQTDETPGVRTGSEIAISAGASVTEETEITESASVEFTGEAIVTEAGRPLVIALLPSESDPAPEPVFVESQSAPEPGVEEVIPDLPERYRPGPVRNAASGEAQRPAAGDVIVISAADMPALGTASGVAMDNQDSAEAVRGSQFDHRDKNDSATRFASSAPQHNGAAVAEAGGASANAVMTVVYSNRELASATVSAEIHETARVSRSTAAASTESVQPAEDEPGEQRSPDNPVQMAALPQRRPESKPPVVDVLQVRDIVGGDSDEARTDDGLHVVFIPLPDRAPRAVRITAATAIALTTEDDGRPEAIAPQLRQPSRLAAHTPGARRPVWSDDDSDANADVPVRDVTSHRAVKARKAAKSSRRLAGTNSTQSLAARRQAVARRHGTLRRSRSAASRSAPTIQARRIAVARQAGLLPRRYRRPSYAGARIRVNRRSAARSARKAARQAAKSWRRAIVASMMRGDRRLSWR